MVDYLPLITTIVSFAFFVLLVRQYLQRHKIHQLLWTIAMLFYSASALMEFLMNSDVMGASIPLFRIYYILAAPLVGLLGAGVMYLLTRKIVAKLFLGFVIMFSLLLALTGFLTPINSTTFASNFSGSLANNLMNASTAFPMTVRAFAIVLNIFGGLALLGGALYSFVRDMSRTYNIFLGIGGLLPMLGGSLLGLLNNSDVFFEFELGGTIFLFIGFVMSARYVNKKGAARMGIPSTLGTRVDSTKSGIQ
ncbi:MAG: hypothetical protein ABSE82_12790 [Nitrososphaerales archaeon]|jgi:hypothetical protein